MPIDPRMVAAPSSPGAPPASQAALNGLYQGMLDLSRRVDGLAAARTVIDPDSLDGTRIAPDAINANHIQAGSITASEIQVGNVVASIMTVGAVNASHIDSASIRANVLDAAVLTAGNAFITSLRASILDAGILTATNATIGTLRASIINSTQIVSQGLQTQVLNAVKAAITDLSSFNVTSGTLTADLIRTGVSPNARVEMGVGIGIKGYPSGVGASPTFAFDTTTGAVTVGAISVTGATGTSVPASTLTGFVGGGNLLKDSSAESGDPALPAAMWASANGGTVAKSTAQAFHGTKSFMMTYSSSIGQRFGSVVTYHGVPITSLVNRPVVYSAWVYVTGPDNTTPATNVSLRISTNAVVVADATIASIPKDTWTRVILKGTIPAGATNVFVSIFNPYTSGSNTVYYDGLQFEFGDAATAYNPKADEIVYGKITTVELAVGAVQATNIDADAVTGTKIKGDAIDGKTITGATFQTAAAGSARVAFDSAGFYVQNAGSSTKIVNVTSSGGVAFRADTTGSPPANQRLSWLNASGVTVADVWGQISSGAPEAHVAAYGALSDATARAFIGSAHTATVGENTGYLYGESTATTASVVAATILGAGGSQTKTIIDSAGQSSFPQLPALASRKINFGITNVSVSASTVGTATGVAHGLGTTPTLIVASAQDQRYNAIADTYAGTTFRIVVRDVDASSTTATIPVAWVAVV